MCVFYDIERPVVIVVVAAIAVGKPVYFFGRPTKVSKIRLGEFLFFFSLSDRFPTARPPE